MHYMSFLFYGNLVINDNENLEVKCASLYEIKNINNETLNKRLDILKKYNGEVIY